MSVSTVDMCAITGLTYRQADHWFRRGYLRAKSWTPTKGNVHNGPGTERRLYNDDELMVAALMVRLTAAGLTVPAAEKAARFMVETGTTVARIGAGIDVTVAS